MRVRFGSNRIINISFKNGNGFELKQSLNVVIVCVHVSNGYGFVIILMNWLITNQHETF